MENPNYYGILPANVRYDKNLKPMEKILYTELTALSNKNGYCNAKNIYFGKLYDVHKNTVGSWINNLEKNGYIKIELIYAGDTKQVIERRIYISSPPINKKIDTPQRKDCDPVNEKIDTHINEKMEDNNTREEYYKKNSSSKKEKEEYRRHSQNENIQTSEVEQAWRDCKLAEYKYAPVENINIAVRTFGLVEVIKAIQRISESSLMKTKTNIDIFFNKNTDFEQIRKTHNGTFDDRKPEEILRSTEYTPEDLEYTFGMEEEWPN